MSLRFGLSEEDINKINEVFLKSPELKKVIIYGSRAKGNYRKGSDIDLVLVFPNGTLGHQMEIEDELDDLYLPYKIDLSILSNIENADLLNHIERVEKVFFQRKS